MSEQYRVPSNSESISFLDAPAPWELRGSAYICFLRCSSDFLSDYAFVPKSLRDRWTAQQPTLLMYVNYNQSPVGHYHELLFIPGYFKFDDGLSHLSITRIFVSSMDSVMNGRKNWGIPKEIADFEVSHQENVTHISVKREGKKIAQLAFRSWPISIPFSTIFLPKRLYTLGQQDDGQTFIYAPKASGWLRNAKLITADINQEEFPAVKSEQSIGAIHLTSFKMHFPEAKKI